MKEIVCKNCMIGCEKIGIKFEGWWVDCGAGSEYVEWVFCGFGFWSCEFEFWKICEFLICKKEGEIFNLSDFFDVCCLGLVFI